MDQPTSQPTSQPAPEVTEEQVVAWLQAQEGPEAEALLEYLEEEGYGTVGST